MGAVIYMAECQRGDVVREFTGPDEREAWCETHTAETDPGHVFLWWAGEDPPQSWAELCDQVRMPKTPRPQG